MEGQAYHIDRIRQQGMLPLFYHDDPSVCVSIVRALYEAGVRIIEFTNRGEFALQNFRLLVSTREKEWKDLLLAAGTIRTADNATRFIEAGADFLISPVFDADVCDVAYLHKVLWIPGCMTPTEIHMAENAGCKLVKLFPGNILGPSFVSGIRELFPNMQFMPTGGVEAKKENLEAWFDAGVCAVGMGSKLFDKEMIKHKDYAGISRIARQAMELVNQVRVS